MYHPGRKKWYVVYSKPHKEECAQFHLRLKGLEVFFPRLLLPESAIKRRRIVPLFPNYLFVRIYLDEEYHYMLWCPGVKSLVRFNGSPAPLDERIVASLMQQATPDGIIRGRSSLKVGQEVQISGGSFDGLVGIIQGPPDARGRVKILMKLLSRQVKVELPAHLVDGGWVSYSPQVGNGDIGSHLPEI